MMPLLRQRLLPLLALTGSAWLSSVHCAEPPTGNVVSEKEIEQALAPAPRTRGLTRGITLKPREDEPGRNEEANERQAAIDLSIPFDLNSSRLQPAAIEQLRQLASALQSAVLRESRFLIAGHTDASGGATYNRELSARRAEAVKQFLVAAGIDAVRLETEGFGAGQLLTPDQPDSPVNRRVEIRNIGGAP
jgi:outer membrane protein OmpA-like peptidoglycan-associated protein